MAIALTALEVEMLDALRGAEIWLARMVTDGGHHGCASPEDCERTLRKVERLIANASNDEAGK